MNACTSYINMKKAAKSSAFQDTDDDVNFNIIEITYGGLKNYVNHVDYEPLACKKCKSFFNKFSQLLDKDAYEKAIQNNSKLAMSDAQKAEKDEEVKFEKEGVVSLSDDTRAWICEFCYYHNVVGKETAVPSAEDMYYMIEKAKPKEHAKTTNTDTNGPIEVSEDDSNLIFCIDISGSMDSNEKSKDGKYVTRLNCVKQAILAQLEDLKKAYPQRQIGIVLFESTVHILGDCCNAGYQVKENELNDFDQLFEIGKGATEKNFNHPIRESYDNLKTTVSGLKTKGITALGPALVVSLGMATGRPGSRLIICTDGMANKGMGNVESQSQSPETKKFYEKVGDYAVDRGISVSVITIAGTQCKIELLGPLTDRTAGTITKVDSTSMSFKETADDAIVATGVNLKVILHSGLAFVNENKASLTNDESILAKTIGNVTDRNETTVEFRLKTKLELDKSSVDLSSLEHIPLQAQINFTDLKGNKLMRVITRQQKVADSDDVIEKDANLKLIANHVQKQTAEMAIKGDYAKAGMKNKKFENYMVNNKNLGQNMGAEEQMAYIADWQSTNLDVQQACFDMLDSKVQGAQKEEKAAKIWKAKQMKKK